MRGNVKGIAAFPLSLRERYKEISLIFASHLRTSAFYKASALASFCLVLKNDKKMCDLCGWKDDFCRATPAAQLISWLQWHLPPILLPAPHKQIKQLYLSPSRLHFTLMTLHLHLSFVSLSLYPLTLSVPWQPPGLSFICKYLYVIGWKKKKTVFFFLLQNKHCPQSRRLPTSVSDSAPLIGHGLQREQCLLSPITG